MKKLNQYKKIFKGACVRYDAVDEILIATPFKGGPNCWNDFIAVWSSCNFHFIRHFIRQFVRNR